jgi:hypothetical protein
MANVKNYRRSLLQGTGTVLLASLGATMAHGADATIVTTASAGVADTTVVDAQIVASTPLFKSSATTATASAITGSVVSSGTATGTVSVLNNITGALASANIAATTVGLEVISTDSGTAPSDGIAVSSASLNTGLVNAYASAQTIAATLTGFESGAVAVDGNRITATTTINSTTTTISGAVPIGYANTATSEGTATVDADGGAASVVTNLAGSIVSSTVQKSTEAASTATVGSDGTTGDGIDISLSLIGAANNDVTGSASLDGNATVATYTGNSAATTIGLGSADSSLAGTVVVGNLQNYSGDTAGTTNASNLDTTIKAAVTATAFDNTFVGSALSVNSNRIASSATANTATNAIRLADGLAYTGSASGNDAQSTVLTNGTDVVTSADLVIASSQMADNSTDNTSLDAVTDNAIVSAVVENSVNSTIDVSRNRVSAAATGDDLTSSVSNGTGSALFSGAVSVAARQTLGDSSGPVDAFDVSATNSDTLVSATVGVVAATGTAGVVSGSDVSLSGNISSASATGARLNQSVALDATTLGLGDGVASVATGNGASATGAALVTSVQIANGDTGVTAEALRSQVILTSNDKNGTSAGSALLVSGNVQEAFAASLDASNSVALTGSSVGSEVGIANEQTADFTSATVSANASLVVTDALGSATVAATAALTGNIERAVATGATASNMIDVVAQSVTVASDGSVAADSAARVAVAAFATVNVQNINDDVTALAQPVTSQSGFKVQVGDSVNAGSSVDNNSNVLAAQAQGAVASNATMLDIATLAVSGGDFAPAGSVTSLQSVAAGADVSASAVPNGAALVLTDLGSVVADTVTSASVSTSSNVVSATADGAKVVNSLAVASTTLVDFADGYTAGAFVEAAFGIASQQEGGDAVVSSTLRGAVNSTASDSALVLTDIAGVVTGSSVASTGNLLSALANSNDAANTLTVSANTLQTAAGIGNVQSSDADVSATIGFAGTSASGASGGVTIAVGDAITNSSVSVDRNVVQGSAITNTATNLLSASATSMAGAVSVARADTSAAGSFTLNNEQTTNAASSAVADVQSTFSIDQAQTATADITGSALSVSGNSQLGEAAGNSASNTVSVSATDLDANVGTNEVTAALASVQGGTLEVNASSGMTVFSNIASTSSTVAMDDNTNTARGLGNNASNLLSVAGTNIASASTTDSVVSDTSIGADYALSNMQNASGDIDTTATASVSNDDVSDATTPGVTSGTISLSSNANTATTTFNAAVNAVAVNSAASAGANVATAAGLGNLQDANTATDIVTAVALSTVQVSLNGNDTGPVEMLDNSTLKVEANSNRASATLNSATNSLVAYGANIENVGNANVNAVANSLTATETADFAVGNSQSAAGTGLSAQATTTIAVNDGTTAASGGVVASDVSIASNATRAEANANSANNAAVISADAQLGATATIVSQQTNAVVDTTATASSSVTAGFNSGTLALEALDGSSLTMAGNSTTAVARGNSASNAMTYASGANYASSNVGATVTDTTEIATAAAVVLNRQDNGTSNVTASAGSTTYGVALNNSSTAANAGVLNSTVRVASNSVNAFAFGNTASNSLTMTALNTGMPTAAVSSFQASAGAIIARTETVAFTVTNTGTIGASSLSAIGNSVGAQAIGNSSATTVVGR